MRLNTTCKQILFITTVLLLCSHSDKLCIIYYKCLLLCSSLDKSSSNIIAILYIQYLTHWSRHLVCLPERGCMNHLIDRFMKVLCKFDHVRRLCSQGRGQSCQGLDLVNHWKSSHMQDTGNCRQWTVQLVCGDVNSKQMRGIHWASPSWPVLLLMSRTST